MYLLGYYSLMDIYIPTKYLVYLNHGRYEIVYTHRQKCALGRRLAKNRLIDELTFFFAKSIYSSTCFLSITITISPAINFFIILVVNFC